MRAHRSSAMQSDINVTPLIDVCLVLLIVFMVVLPAMVNGIDVKLPETSVKNPVDSRVFPVTVKEDGTVYLDTLIVRREEVLRDSRQRTHNHRKSDGLGKAQHHDPTVTGRWKTNHIGEILVERYDGAIFDPADFDERLVGNGRQALPSTVATSQPRPRNRASPRAPRFSSSFARRRHPTCTVRSRVISEA